MSKSSKNRERRERVEQLRREAKAAERRRSLTIVAVCAVVAVLIVGVAVATRPYDFTTCALCGVAALIGFDTRAETDARKKTYAEWRAAELKRPLP